MVRQHGAELVVSHLPWSLLGGFVSAVGQFLVREWAEIRRKRKLTLEAAQRCEERDRLTEAVDALRCEYRESHERLIERFEQTIAAAARKTNGRRKE
jgi:hypothetical protein